MTNYPDISDLLERKRLGRERAAARSFTEKVDWLERTRADLEPLRQLRLAEQAKREDSARALAPSTNARSDTA
jgi:hypothetical protein